jgi:hypothetical protein
MTLNTTNNIHVGPGSQVGQINAGAIIYLDRVVSEFKATGAEDIASALQGFTQAVLDSHEVAADSQRQVLDLLQAIVEELKKPKTERNSSVLGIALKTIDTVTTAASALSSHWGTLKNILESLIR